ncbi:MAG TPA: peptidoglycan DD-metalloendopeptidase family protein [Thermoleophilaceae bacterium]|nr:peptidoglycan DD-metalloendopeptidase family protein [Thermoleophilaceae bacterium]
MGYLRSAARTGTLAALAVALLIVPAVFASPAHAVSANTAALQVALKALHHYDGSIDGIRGPQTTRALKHYQRAHHLTVDGIVGSETLRELGWRGRKRWGQRYIERGDKGWDVAMLQFLLKRRGYYPGTVDGGFGHMTDKGVHRFQRSRGLSADGVVGPITMRALSGHSSSGGGGGGPTGPVRFYRPVDAPITSPFGWRWGRPHQGIDFGASYGTHIEAAGVGTVSFAGWNSGGYGYLVIIQHRLGYQSWYAHMSRVATSSGRSVSGGDTIGYVGSTGHVTGPHLHFEVRHNGTPIDPMPYLLSGTAKINPNSYLGTEDPDGCAPSDGGQLDPRTARLADCK